ncbi:MAG: class I SAM-dependent rRNA methyltransferase [Parachlamydiales bacterium]|jgi:23S rRNA (cytosine1962-C5)-methyltransferase
MRKDSFILKKGKEKSLLQRHPWIFSGAIEFSPENYVNGSIYKIYSYDDVLLGYGYANSETSISIRMLCFSNADPFDAIAHNIKNAIAFRKALFDENITNAYRLINSEGDLLPGLIVDYYNGHLVIQVQTLGMEKLKSFIIDTLLSELPKTKSIYEKSLSASRTEEGLTPFEDHLFGENTGDITVIENGIKFYVNYATGQKTGFFLDQREMRAFVGSVSTNKKVLNCFSYTGGFSIYALKNDAKLVDSVEISKTANDCAKNNLKLNNLDDQRFFTEDVFSFLQREDLNYDLIILDPPAFAKKRKDVQNASGAYKKLHSLVFQKAKPKTVLVTSSCSYYFDFELFKKTIFFAAYEAKRDIKIIGFHRLASDHPINIYHPQMDYLKSLVLYIE